MNKNNKFKHLMVDVETMGNRPGCALVSLAAVQFNIETGETGREFYLGIDIKSCTDLGLHISADVVEWWMVQPEDSRKSFIERNRYELSKVLEAFTGHYPLLSDMEVWGNGPRFDFGVLMAAYDACKLKTPWDFRKERCVRTMLSLYPEAKNEVEFDGTKHNPLDDCKFQIAFVSRAYNRFKNPTVSDVLSSH